MKNIDGYFYIDECGRKCRDEDDEIQNTDREREPEDD